MKMEIPPSPSNQTDSFTINHTQQTLNQSINKPLPKKAIIQTTIGYANLRMNPSTKEPILGIVTNGTCVTILSQQTNTSGELWYKIERKGNDPDGWMLSKLLIPCE